jgi:hypothetical protein
MSCFPIRVPVEFLGSITTDNVSLPHCSNCGLLEYSTTGIFLTFTIFATWLGQSGVPNFLKRYAFPCIPTESPAVCVHGVPALSFEGENAPLTGIELCN